jgi:valyl-tRNA synthetase
MSEIPKAYEPQSVEDKWYDFWVKQGCFTADPARVSDQRPAYSIVIPPPNVTGMLHMGHVLNNTIQDILARKARMDGKEVLWLPGTDHAGIATEGMVAKQIWKEEKKTKQEIGREEFLRRVWTWKEKHGGIIIEQLKKLGCSCDWTRERFTMDDDYVRCVQRVFVDLYKKGLIYRGKRMVNWCPATQTALSDEEVEMKPQKGKLWYFRVQVVDAGSRSSGRESAQVSSPESQSQLTSAATGGGEGQELGATPQHGPVVDEEGRVWLTIATTRPETIPGDTAIAVNPNDPRYAPYIGKFAVRPLPVENQAQLPIIADEHIDPKFGTGVLKVTPAHDQADFDIGQRHRLEAIDIMNPDGTMNEFAGADLQGLERFAARKLAAEKLAEIGALLKEEPYENNVGFSQRAGVPIEPRLSEQWFLKYPSVEQAKACVAQDEGSARVPRADSGVAPESPHPSGEAAISERNDAARGEGVEGGTPSTARGTRALPGQMRFHPQRWAKVYDHWLANIRDWCISRQLWWGHRVPVWSVTCEGSKTTEIFHALDQCLADTLEDLLEQRGSESAIRIIDIETGASLSPTVSEFNHGLGGRRVRIHVAQANEAVGAALERNGFTQDPDVLDTWCSSWLWPFATMGWTGDKLQDSRNPTLQAFYPTTDLVTGPDIIFFWVARMIMAGYEYMGDLPFRNVYFTGIIRDKQGRKMSKTLGNSPDPLELIAKYGADALRFGTMRSAPLGQDVLFDEKDVELGRNFCNKLWNACRFRQMQGNAERGMRNAEFEAEINPDLLTSDDKWILLRLDQAIGEVTQAFADYKFNEATATLYRFFWSEYCDWYTEASKAVLSGQVDSLQGCKVTSAPHATMQPCNDVTPEKLRANKLAVIDFVLGHTLRLFHPFLPFITEELWQGMGFQRDLPAGQGGDTLMFAPWPKPFSDDERTYFGLDATVEQFVAAKYELVTKGRNLRREFNIAANKKVKFVLKPAGQLDPAEAAVLQILLNAEPFEVDQNHQPAKGTPSVLSPLGELYLPLEGLIDPAAETARLRKELEKVEAEIAKVEAKLANSNFTGKAPEHILAEHRQRLSDWQARREQIQAALKTLEG